MEKKAFRISGWLALFIALLLAAAIVGFISLAIARDLNEGMVAAVAVILVLVIVALLSGLVVISPNDARVIQFFGRYVGTISDPGLHCTWPLTEKEKISKRIRNFETARLKVSDADGNPVEIAAVVVWRVVDTYAAKFAV